MKPLPWIVSLCLICAALPLSAHADPPAKKPAKKAVAPLLDFDREHVLTFQRKRVRLALLAMVQTQLAFYTGADNLIADGDPAEKIGARLRRARFGFAGQLLDVIDFAVSAEANVHGLDLLDAWIGYRLGTPIGLAVGARKVPFSRFERVGAGRGALIERPLGVHAMAPGRQVGLTIEGNVADGMFKYAVGAYNGFERHTNFHEGYVQGTALLGNGLDEEALKRVGIEQADAFVAVTQGDNRNIMAAQIAKHIFKVPKVLCRIYDPLRRDLYNLLGLEAISPTTVFTQMLKEKLET